MEKDIIEENHDFLCLFSKHTHRPILKLLLKKGFRHCLIIFRRDPNSWIYFDPLESGAEKSRLGNVGAKTLSEVYRTMGFVVVTGVRKSSLPSRGKKYATCVGACKRIIGLKQNAVLTPYQLYKHLKLKGC